MPKVGASVKKTHKYINIIRLSWGWGFTGKIAEFHQS